MIVICDIDGTLSDSRHREYHLAKSPADWEAFFQGCDKDPVIVPVQRAIHALWMSGNKIMLVSGRPERVRAKTAVWLDEHGIPHVQLILRADDDHRPSHVSKRDLLIKHVTTALHPNETVLAIDNSESDCAMYRELGIATLQFTQQ